MRIEITPGQVKVRHVQVRENRGGLITIEVGTPFVRRPAVALAYVIDSARGGLASPVIELYSSPGNMSEPPTRVTLWLETALEREMFDGELIEIESRKFAALILGFTWRALADGVPIERWEQWERPRVDYLKDGPELG